MTFKDILKKTKQEQDILTKAQFNYSTTASFQQDEISLCIFLNILYKNYVQSFYPNDVNFWPTIDRHPNILFLKDKKSSYVVIVLRSPIEPSITTINTEFVSFDIEKEHSISDVQKIIEKSFYIKKTDFIFAVEINNNPVHFNDDLLEAYITYNFKKHSMIMNKLPKKIFLSHKSKNKDQVKKYHNTLKLLGFSPWLDENDIHSGEVLHRSLLEGINQSCAIVFFITDAFHDKEFIQREIDLAINRNIKDDNFKIITLVFNNAKVPESLSNYVWKNINNDLDGICEILKALPLKIGDVFLK